MYPADQATAVLDKAVGLGHRLPRHRGELRRRRERDPARPLPGYAAEGRLPRDQDPRTLAHPRHRAQGGRGEPQAAADRPPGPAAPAQPRRRGRPRGDRGHGRGDQGPVRAARPEGRAVHRDDEPHRRRGHGPGDRAQRPRLRAAGHEPGAGGPVRGAGAAGREQEEPRRDPDEGHRPGQADGGRRGRPPRLSFATPGACRSRLRSAACRSSSTSRRTWPRREPTPPRCLPPRWSGSGSSSPAARSSSSGSSPTTTTGGGRPRRRG